MTLTADIDWFGPDTATFGDRVSGAREAAGMNQGELARRLGIKKATLVAWEDDVSEPRANKLSMMAGILNVSIVWLLTGEGEGAPVPGQELKPDLDLGDVLSELRDIRTSMQANAERAAKVEKKLQGLVRQHSAA